MKRLFACLPLCVLLGACASSSLHQHGADQRAAHAEAAQALAATAPPRGQPLDPWLQAERARIETERDAAAQRFEVDEKTCWGRFAVNACLRAARGERRNVVDRLRQQELALNEVERQRRTEDRLRQIEAKQPREASR
ncbi:hypothetical protein [Ottowia testudinis]|uniref:Lipoprotein n=1 Tax=Ottowia testudinis TaxID=2816950 RepID=A0A975CEN3_9BURK|nr:hypothetical protein [Ottowia testudinis]QTD44442.1 hypothetical protein J1M35_15240 [Ottowia testudinis]